ncbi:MAG: hypothetical protein KDJ65_29735 [Anaerolineae bacterium]|nr:hypothetical protein [Anaerolineae bacterium]
MKRLNCWLCFLMLFLAACSSAPRSGDVQPLPEDVPTQTATLQTQESNTAPAESEAPAADSEITQTSADTTVLSYSQTGGVGGFCNELTIASDGAYTLSRPCDQFETSGMLEDNDFNSFQSWVAHLPDFELMLEDNPGNTDNLISHLTFNGSGDSEADDAQKQVIFDWVNGLMVRIDSPTIEVPPTPELSVLDPAGLCPDITRPALLTINFESPDLLTLVDPDNQATCEMQLSRLPVGRIAPASGSIFYPIFNPETEMVSILRLSNDGEQTLLPFTELPAQEQSPTDFVVSTDGSKIAWSQTIIDNEVDPPLYTNSLWLANSDGSNPVTILEQVQNEETRFVAPIRFSADGSHLFYALQPDVPGLALSGRFDNLYRVPTAGGQPELVYTCSAEEQNGFCISGFALDGTILTVIQPADNSIRVLDTNGTDINTIPLPATDYVERVSFSPNGNLAFVTATLTQPSEDETPRPSPGYLTVLSLPYTDQAQTLLSDNSVGTLWGWLDDSRLIYGVIDEEGNTSTALLTLEGQSVVISPDVAIGVLR